MIHLDTSFLIHALIRASAPLATANPGDFERFAAESLTIVAP